MEWEDGCGVPPAAGVPTSATLSDRWEGVPRCCGRNPARSFRRCVVDSTCFRSTSSPEEVGELVRGPRTAGVGRAAVVDGSEEEEDEEDSFRDGAVRLVTCNRGG